ncbi:hypothetical protein HNY73_012115 [Argiope bruennichi]|uniref:Uncharacterized protein n=1 Tax=Argiope bruennichi TaxID=94029 RepID=A0A8T0EUH6_ARGBR|nr:hypothetical protein HNY73_012115 [Argiope bruennichi]
MVSSIPEKPQLVMTESDNAVINPINYELIDLTSEALGLFDIRNWFACFISSIKTGKCFIAYCWNMWNAFLDSTQLSVGNTEKTCCAACGDSLSTTRKESNEISQTIPLTGKRQIENISGRWVFVPDHKQPISKKTASSMIKNRCHPAVDHNSRSISTESITPSVISFSARRVASKTSSQRILRLYRSPHRKHIHSQKIPKSPKEKSPKTEPVIERSLPLISQRPKRQRN